MRLYDMSQDKGDSVNLTLTNVTSFLAIYNVFPNEKKNDSRKQMFEICATSKK